MNASTARILCLAMLLCVMGRNAHSAQTIVVGSKIFTEGYVLGELAAQTIEASSAPVPVTRKLGMGSTGILFQSLTSGAIDVYADYTGTLTEAIIKNPQLKSQEQIQAAVLKLKLVMSGPLGFNNTYALAVGEKFAQDNDLRTVSDLARLKDTLRAAFSYEFMDREDGYPGLAAKYHLQLNPKNVNRMEHSLTYQAIDQNAVDVIDVYSTDAKIRKFNLRVLRDDLNYFPVYQAVWVARKAFVDRYPAQWQVLRKLEGTIDENTMLNMNAQADIDKKSFAQIAADFRGAQARVSDSLARGIAH